MDHRRWRQIGPPGNQYEFSRQVNFTPFQIIIQRTVRKEKWPIRRCTHPVRD